MTQPLSLENQWIQPSSDFVKIAESLKQAQLDMDNAIEAESSKPARFR